MTMTMPQITQLASNWWALALRGVLSILVGVLALTKPGATLAALVLLIGAYMFVDGVFAIMAALRGIRTGDRWGWMLVEGILGIVAGIKLRKIIEGEWLLILAGALSLALGIYVLMRPGVGLLLLVTWVGVYALFTGVVMLMLAFKVRRWSHEHPYEGAAAT